jgi:hypothetical protein
MQPNLNIPLYLVAPDEKREKVIAEINRPTFARLDPPLSEVCRFISFGELSNKLDEVSGYVRYLWQRLSSSKPDVMRVKY